MKKALVILLALVALVATAYAGTQPAKTNAKVTLNAMAYGDNSNQEGANWVRIVEAFMKENPNVTVVYEMLYDEAYHQKVTARIASGDIPDLAYMGADARWGKNWADSKQQFDLKPYLDAKVFDLGLIGPMGPNGEIWEVPLGTANLCTVLFFNVGLAKSLGIAEPKTYEDMVAMVPKAQAAGVDVVSIDGADGWAWGSCLMSGIIARLSGDANWVQKAVAGKAKFTDQPFVDGLALIGKMVADGVISDKAVLVDYGGNTANFANGKAIFMVQGQWASGDAAKAGDVKVMAWPKLPGEKANMAGSIAGAINPGYGITQKGAKDVNVRNAALKFIGYFNSVAESTQRLRDGGIVAPVLKNFVVPADLTPIIASKVQLAQNTKIITDVIDAYLSGAPNDALNAGMQKIASGTATAAEVAAEVEGLLRK